MAGAKGAKPFSPGRAGAAGGKRREAARDSSLRFSGEGRAPGKGKQGPPTPPHPGAQLWGKGRDSGLTPPPSGSSPGPPPRTLPPSYLRGESEALCVARFL